MVQEAFPALISVLPLFDNDCGILNGAFCVTFDNKKGNVVSFYYDYEKKDSASVN
jgi:hypothetical protein